MDAESRISAAVKASWEDRKNTWKVLEELQEKVLEAFGLTLMTEKSAAEKNISDAYWAKAIFAVLAELKMNRRHFYLTEAFLEALEKREDPFRAVMNKIDEIFRNIPQVQKGLLDRATPQEKEWLVIDLAGQIRTIIALRPYLKAALRQGGKNPYDRLLGELPGAVLVALAESEPGDTLLDIRDRAVNDIALKARMDDSEQQGKKERVKRKKAPPGTKNVSNLAEWVAKQQAALEQVKPSLPEREAEVLKLWEEGCTEQDMADRMGIPLGTVKSRKRSIRRKLHQHLP